MARFSLLPFCAILVLGSATGSSQGPSSGPSTGPSNGPSTGPSVGPSTGPSASTVAPTTPAPTTLAPTTEAPTTVPPTTVAPTTEAPTTKAPTTVAPTTEAPTTSASSTADKMMVVSGSLELAMVVSDVSQININNNELKIALKDGLIKAFQDSELAVPKEYLHITGISAESRRLRAGLRRLSTKVMVDYQIRILVTTATQALRKSLTPTAVKSAVEKGLTPADLNAQLTAAGSTLQVTEVTVKSPTVVEEVMTTAAPTTAVPTTTTTITIAATTEAPTTTRKQAAVGQSGCARVTAWWGLTILLVVFSH